ncbi:hypothetical protein [Gordonia iterans]
MTSADPRPHSPSAPPSAPARPARTLSRRTVLRGGASLTVAVAAGSAVAACSTGPTERELAADKLVPLARTADLQRRQAQQLAPRETAYTAALQQVAEERGAHATALVDEINRLHSPAALAASIAPGAPQVSLDELRDALGKAAREATGTAISSSGFQAGLLASISASCAALREVQLA